MKASCINFMVGGIRTPRIASALTDGEDQKEETAFCESCRQIGILSKLEKRLWVFNTNTKELERVNDEDRENFRQCYNCGDTVPIYEVKKEAKISDFVETSDDPFDNHPGNMETFGRPPSESVAVGLKKKYKRKTHKDPEIQEFLDRGDQVENINES